MKKSILLITLFVTLFANACISRGSGTVITKTRPVGNFNKIIITGYGELVVVQDKNEEESLRITAEDDIIPLINVSVSDNTLFIEGQELGTVIPTQPIKIYVSMKDVVGLEGSGLSSIYAEKIETERLKLTSSIYGTIKIEALTAEQLIINMTEDSSMDISGEITTQELDIAGNADYRAAKLMSNTAVINIGGTGTATIWANETVNGIVNGNGDLLYYGPAETTVEVIDSGKIKSREDFDSVE